MNYTTVKNFTTVKKTIADTLSLPDSHVRNYGDSLGFSYHDRQYSVYLLESSHVCILYYDTTHCLTMCSRSNSVEHLRVVLNSLP